MLRKRRRREDAEPTVETDSNLLVVDDHDDEDDGEGSRSASFKTNAREESKPEQELKEEKKKKKKNKKKKRKKEEGEEERVEKEEGEGTPKQEEGGDGGSYAATSGLEDGSNDQQQAEGKKAWGIKPKKRSRQKNIRKDHRSEDQKPAHLRKGASDYAGRPLTKETKDSLKQREKSGSGPPPKVEWTVDRVPSPHLLSGKDAPMKKKNKYKNLRE